jgi:hypothetical protein
MILVSLGIVRFWDVRVVFVFLDLGGVRVVE